jgi:hypothetical protein
VARNVAELVDWVRDDRDTEARGRGRPSTRWRSCGRRTWLDIGLVLLVDDMVAGKLLAWNTRAALPTQLHAD